MLRKANNVFSVLLDDNKAASSLTPGDLVTDSNISVGELAMVNAGHRVTDLATLADGDTFFIIQGKGTGKKLMVSPALTKGKVKITTAAHKAAAQQITAIGYNGTTGDLTVANDASYFIKIRKNDNDAANRSQPMSLFAQFKTGAAATQAELAFGLATNGIKNMSDEPANGYLRFEVIANGALTTFTGNVDVVYGSKGAVSVSHGMTVGVATHVRIDGADYLATATDADNFTLNMPYQGESGTVLSSNAGTVAGATSFGVTLRGVAAPFDVNAFRDYYANRFTATFSDTTTPVTHLQGAFNGNGVWQQVAMDEYMSYGYEGQNGMLGVPPALRDQVVRTVPEFEALESKYSAINIAWEESISGLVSMAGGKGNVVVYLNLSDNAGTGELAGTGTSGEELAIALGLTPADLNEA